MCQEKIVLLKDIEEAYRSTLNNGLITYFNSIDKDNMDWKVVNLYQQAAVEQTCKWFMSHFSSIIEEFAIQVIRETCQKVIKENKDV